jgi:hypothetical protein
MKKSKYEVIRHEINEGFYIEIVENNELIEFYLSHNNYAIKSLMFGLYKKDCPPDQYENYIISNVNDYIKNYIEEYF